MKKYSNQVIIEAAVISSLLIGIVTAGSVVTTSTPQAWQILQNPETVTVSQYDLRDLALGINATLTSLAKVNYIDVSTHIGFFHTADVPQSVNQTLQEATSEISSLNISIPLTIQNFNNSDRLIQMKEFINVSSDVSTGCSELQTANSSFLQFQNSTTPTFASEGVPVSNYSVGMKLVGMEISSLQRQCVSLSSELGALSGSSSLLKISSNQRLIFTGGDVLINASLTRNGTGIGGETIYFYLNGTYFGSLKTGSDGLVLANLTIPFVYKQVITIEAIAPSNSIINFNGATSNQLNFNISFNETKIMFGA